jgi:hypothetical protein
MSDNLPIETILKQLQITIMHLEHRFKLLLVNPTPEVRLKSWKRHLSYCWIHATDDFSKLGKRQRQTKSLQEIFPKPASVYYEKWKNKSKDFFLRKSQIIAPEPEVGIANFLEVLRVQTILHHKQNKWRESLLSFINFLRWESSIEDQGYIDFLFPEELSVFDDQIIRERLPQEYPIDIFAVSEILRLLAKRTLTGKRHSRETAADALGFAWVCIAFSYSRLPSRLKYLHDLSLSDLHLPVQPNLLPHLTIPTLAGRVKVPISPMLYSYLSTLSMTHNSEHTKIFKSSERSLRRTLLLLLVLFLMFRNSEKSHF